MSRSNDPAAQTGDHRPQWRQLAELDLALRPSQPAPDQPPHWPTQAQSAQPQYAYPGGSAGQTPLAYSGQPASQAASYHYPQAPSSALGYGHGGLTPDTQPGAFAAPPTPQPGGHRTYAPQFDRTLSGQSQAFDAHRGYEPARAPEQAPFIPRPAPLHDVGLPPLQTGPTTRGHRDPTATGTMHELHPELRGATYDQWPAGHDPASYDLGSYMPSAAVNQRAYEAHQQGAARQGYAGPHWQDHDGFGIPRQDPASAFANYGHLHGGSESLPVAGQPLDQDDADYEVDEPRQGYRGVVIVVALVGAIAVGGGLAYAYKTFGRPAAQTVPPVVKADNRPAKTQPADPGGKQFAHKDSKLMGRLGEESGDGASPQPTEPTSSDTDPSGVRKVSTLVVGRDGSIAAPAVEAPPRLPPPTVEVPGLTLVDAFGGGGPGGTAAPPRPIELVPQPSGPAQTVAAAPSAAAVRPQVVAKVNPAASPAGPAAGPQPQATQGNKAQRTRLTSALHESPPVSAAPLPKKAGFTATPAAPAPSAKTGSAGYVVVLSSQKSRMDALKAFADLQQKYGSVLESKIPDVQEADLSARGLGTVYRLVAGPPGSREAANGICNQLKSAGHTGCWVTTY